MARKKLKARGNFRRVTPKVAAKYIAYWEKKGVTKANEIPDGKNATLQRARLMEAKAVWLDYLRKLESYEQELASYKEALAKYEEVKKTTIPTATGLAAQYLKPTKPVKPSLSGPKSARGGNFKPVTKKQALNYLRSLANRAAHNAVSGKDGRVTLKDLNLKVGSPLRKTRVEGGQVLPASQFYPRVREAAQLVGADKASEIFAKAKQLQVKLEEQKLKKQKAAEERKKKVDAKKVAQLQKKLERLKKQRAEVEQALRDLRGVAARAARRRLRRR